MICVKISILKSRKRKRMIEAFGIKLAISLPLDVLAMASEFANILNIHKQFN